MKYLSTVLIASVLWVFVSDFAVAKQPNVIVIFTDDHGYADLNCQGVLDGIQTPHIDRLAKNGVRMTDGYCTAPQCGPSRVGLISGQYQTKLGYESNQDFSDPKILNRFRAIETLPHRLQKAGYATCLAGKSHLGSNDSDEIAKLGFDKVFFKHSGAAGHWNMNLKAVDVQPQVQTGGYYHLDMITDFGCAFIQRFKNQPFFLYAAYRAPHVPLDAPPKYTDRFAHLESPKRRKALGMIAAVDDGVGKILETLRANDLEENTLIFVIGDNGASIKPFNAHLERDDDPVMGSGSLNTPLSGSKGTLIEGGIRVPYLAYWKGTIPPGQVYRNPVITLDVAATANALAGNDVDPVLDGVNLIPYLTAANDNAPHKSLFWRWEGQSAIRQGDWKYIRGGQREYLYHLKNDITESHNMLSAHPDRAKDMRRDLDRWSQTLSPPGLAKQMPAMGHKHFDWYLDHQRSGPDAKQLKEEAAARSKLFTKCDANDDGTVTWREYTDAHPGKKLGPVRRAFDNLKTGTKNIWLKPSR